MEDEKNKIKMESELKYWKTILDKEQEFLNQHYRYIYLNHFDLSIDDFHGKNILDIGCGPRGSLEWADMATLRVGLDPLVHDYYKLDGGTLFHKMKYVNSGSEDMPFPDNSFDYVFSINSIDHVDDLELTISEIKRVLKVGGICGIIVEVNHEPTVCEPILIQLDFKKNFIPEFNIVFEKVYELTDDVNLYANIDVNNLYDFSNNEIRPAILVLKLQKRE